MDMHELIATRRTTFSFQDRPVPEDVVRRALQAAHWAPNHKHTYPWRFVLVGPEMKERLADYFADRTEAKLRSRGADEAELPAARSAARAKGLAVPCYVVAYAVQEGDETRQREDYASTCCAVQNFLLAAWADGVASGWKSFDTPQAYALFGLNPAHARIVGLLQLGYETQRHDGRRPPVETVVTRTP
ncbi:MAG TPA: nitroreductase [Pantanalinema sp.]